MGLHSFYPSLAQQKGAQQERTTPCTFMALNTIFASLQSACSSHHFLKKQQPVVRHGYSSRAKHTTHVITVEDQKQLDRPKKEGKPSSDHNVSEGTEGELVHRMDKGSSTAPRFKDERWKNGTWDLNLFVKDGKMDWDSVIVAEARRRKFLQMYPEPATNEAQVLFRSSIIPWSSSNGGIFHGILCGWFNWDWCGGPDEQFNLQGMSFDNSCRYNPFPPNPKFWQPAKPNQRNHILR
ncbi:uncharacterized protein LOC143877161 isoform X3 [Tasmannia lanceolata]|uniref:uncharacterized protein LOC143877161 isoform X3 n=1 Tax=Tasmannia lanceolata TaxID=3420 RepID=UPI004064A7EB